MSWMILCVLAVLIGSAAIIRGLRGRRIGDEPLCSGCGFDLRGTYPNHDLCPECGLELSGARAVHLGRRRMSRKWLALGMALLLPGLVGGGVLTARATGAIDWYRVQPEWMLEQRLTDPFEHAPALSELARRAESGRLSEQRARRILTAVLEDHADPTAPWDVPRQAFTAAAFGLMTDEQHAAFMQNALEARVRLPAEVRHGDRLMPTIMFSTARGFEGFECVVHVSLAEARASRLELRPTVRGNELVGTVGWSRGYGSGFLLEMDRVQPGEHVLDLAWNIRLSHGRTSPVEFVHRMQGLIHVAPRGTEPHAIGGQPELHEHILPHIVLKDVTLARLAAPRLSGPVLSAHVGIWNQRGPGVSRPVALPQRVEFEIIARASQREWSLGTLGYSWSGGTSRSVTGFLDGFEGDHITIILRPDDPQVRNLLGEFVAGELLLAEPVEAPAQ